MVGASVGTSTAPGFAAGEAAGDGDDAAAGGAVGFGGAGDVAAGLAAGLVGETTLVAAGVGMRMLGVLSQATSVTASRSAANSARPRLDIHPMRSGAEAGMGR